jgi:RNA polymerase I-specific transcription initiation factor RRN7
MHEQKRVSAWPEARLMSLVIIATKLLYGLDGVARAPKSSTEPAAVGLRWEDWDKFLRLGNAERRGLLGDTEMGKKELQVDVKEVDIFDMDEEDLDKYMDWFEKTWADKSNTKRVLTYLYLFGFPNCKCPTAKLH